MIHLTPAIIIWHYAFNPLFLTFHCISISFQAFILHQIVFVASLLPLWWLVYYIWIKLDWMWKHASSVGWLTCLSKWEWDSWGLNVILHNLDLNQWKLDSAMMAFAFVLLSRNEKGKMKIRLCVVPSEMICFKLWESECYWVTCKGRVKKFVSFYWWKVCTKLCYSYVVMQWFMFTYW